MAVVDHITTNNLESTNYTDIGGGSQMAILS